ncbi:MAG: uroporphyrinogen-III synthase [Pseudomonadota bacterium]
MSHKPTILITRAEPALSRTRQRLESLGYPVAAHALTQISYLKLGLKQFAHLAREQEGPGGFVCTSANAVDAVLSLEDGKSVLRLRDWAVVGERAEQLITRAGGRLLFPPARDVAELMHAMRAFEQKAGAPKRNSWLYAAAPDRREGFENSGLNVHPVDVYAARDSGGFSDEFVARLRTNAPTFVLAYSARSARLILSAFSKAGLDNLLSQTSWICISDRTMDALSDQALSVANRLVAQQPTEEAMMKCLDQAFKSLKTG